MPGLAKTLIISSLAQCLDLGFARIQFTPDLMPSDITGTEVIQEDRATGAREFKFLHGPIFNNVILADEINRTPPKTQAALLEAMQERQVSVGGKRMPMKDPFFVLATQNPIEQEGTYPLPEAQQDRFMFKIFVDYPNWDEEFDIVRLTTAVQNVELTKVLTGEDIIALQDVIRRVPAADHVIQYAMRLVRATRVTEEGVPDIIRNYVSWGAGPRACQYLILGGKVRAVLHGRFHVSHRGHPGRRQAGTASPRDHELQRRRRRLHRRPDRRGAHQDRAGEGFGHRDQPRDQRRRGTVDNSGTGNSAQKPDG